MSKLNELNSYLAQVQSRMRLLAWLRGAAVFSGTALVVTLLLVIVLNRFAFPAHGITFARMALLCVAGMRLLLLVSRYHYAASRATRLCTRSRQSTLSWS